MKKSSGSDVVTKEYLDQTLNRTLDVRLGMQKDEMISELKDFITEGYSAIYIRIDPLLKKIVNN